MVNLVILVGLKTVLLFVAARVLRQPVQAVARQAVLAVPIGTAFGVLFHVAFHEAIPAIAMASPATFALIAVNTVFSYGLTAMTVALVPIRLTVREARADRRAGLYFAGLLLVSLALLLFSPTVFLQSIGIGAGFMALMEGVALRAGKAGPIAQMLAGSARAMGQLFIATVLFGTAYELFNLVFPVWVWSTLDGLPAWGRFVLMAAGGYVVLLHPMLIAVRLAEDGLTRPPPPHGQGSGP